MNITKPDNETIINGTITNNAPTIEPTEATAQNFTEEPTPAVILGDSGNTHSLNMIAIAVIALSICTVTVC